jgi:endonuclease/exonuclease/phosphatase family metal-dependent hydrolase
MNSAGAEPTAGTPAAGSNAGGNAGSLDACSAEARLKVMTFNIRYDSGGSGPGAWSSGTEPRRDRVLSVVRDELPDVLGIQEALVHQVNDLASGLEGYEVFGVGRDDGEMSGEYMGVLYRTSRLTRIDGGHFWLSTTPEVPGTVFAGSGSNRMATWVVLRDALTSRGLFFLNTHWDNVSASSRELSGALIHERLETLAGSLPRIVTGDFNEGSDASGVKALLSAASTPDRTLLDAYREAHPEVRPDEATFHDFTGGTAGVPIDFVLHSAPFTAVDAAIVRTSFQGAYPSDHFPVTSVLAWTNANGGEPCSALLDDAEGARSRPRPR